MSVQPHGKRLKSELHFWATLYHLSMNIEWIAIPHGQKTNYSANFTFRSTCNGYFHRFFVKAQLKITVQQCKNCCSLKTIFLYISSVITSRSVVALVPRKKNSLYYFLNDLYCFILRDMYLKIGFLSDLYFSFRFLMTGVRCTCARESPQHD